MSTPEKKDDVKREYVFSTFVRDRYNKNNDALIIKEIIHKPGAEPKRRLRTIENYKRPYWITKKQYRVHKDKREFEEDRKLDKFYSTQSNLTKSVFEKINGFRPDRVPQLRDVNSSPYVYGTDITSEDLLKADYAERYGKMFSKSTVAVMDYEWSMEDPKEPIISGIVSMKNVVHIAISAKWWDWPPDLIKKKVREVCEYHHKDLLKNRNIDLRITVHANQTKVVIALMKTVHKLQPDFLAFWNMEGDIEHMLAALKEEDIDPALIFSDPSVPDNYKHFRWNKEAPFKVKSNGERMATVPSQRWHTVYAPASFYCICAMSTFRTVRAREQQRNGYGLDAILHEFLQIGKMKFKAISSKISGRLWHQIMQSKYKPEYMAYLFGDGVFMELLDEKTKDLCETIRPQVDTSSFDKFKSNPRRLATDLHIEEMEEGLVIGSTAKNMVSKLDALIPTTERWIK
jgi:hypothetical protein